MYYAKGFSLAYFTRKYSLCQACVTSIYVFRKNNLAQIRKHVYYIEII